MDDLREPQRRGAHVIVPAPRPRAWPTRPTELHPAIVGAGRVMELDEFLAVTVATALVVVVDGVLVHERYLHGTDPHDRLLGNSATKSVLALVVGQALDNGRLPGLDTPVVDLVPELARTSYADVSLRHLLTMTSGVGWKEDYFDPGSMASGFLRRWRLGEGGLRDALLEMPVGVPPGRRYAYCTPDSLALDWARERATGETFAEAVARLWVDLEAERPAVIGLDSPVEDGGVAMAGGSLAATARDWARIGVLQIDGRWRDDQLVSSAWVDASSRPKQVFLEPGRLPSTLTTHAGFGYHWWPMDVAGERVMADGMRGQFVYVDRPRRTVVVMTSAWPYEDPWWDRQCRDLSYLALPAIAEAALAG
jgi:CubicO group peptidase (beta-lactamase class C family)